VSAVQWLIAGAFVGVGALFGTVEWMARRPGSGVPTLSDMCALAMAYEVRRVPVGRVALLGFWWWVGWHFFAR
jgi:hypothetical protein